MSNQVSLTTISGWGALPKLVEDACGANGLKRLLGEVSIPISALGAPHLRIPLPKMVRLFERAARQVGADEFGFQVGCETSVLDYGEWAAYGASANTLGEALQRVCSALWVHEVGSRMWISEAENHFVWHYTTGLALRHPRRAFSDHLLMPMLKFIRVFLGPDWMPDWIELDYPKPQRVAESHILLQRDVRYGCEAIGMPVAKSTVDAPSGALDVLPRLITSADLRKYDIRNHDQMLEKVIELIDLNLLEGRLDLSSTACLLDIGPRNLQRILLAEGTNFRSLLAEARKRRAVAMLCETRTPIKVIAAELGYGEAENFTRAFRGWCNIGPRAYRTQFAT